MINSVRCDFVLLDMSGEIPSATHMSLDLEVAVMRDPYGWFSRGLGGQGPVKAEMALTVVQYPTLHSDAGHPTVVGGNLSRLPARSHHCSSLMVLGADYENESVPWPFLPSPGFFCRDPQQPGDSGISILPASLVHIHAPVPELIQAPSLTP
jgi:hypothetical protein